jgi:hypothetical protein
MISGVTEQSGYRLGMTNLVKLTSITKRAAMLGLLLAMPLLPVTACSDGGDRGDGGGSEVENGDGQDEDDGGLY